MDQTPDLIRKNIELQRSELAGNIRALESHVKDMTDWRVQFQRNPLKLIGAALASGVFLAWLSRPARVGHNCRCEFD